jgi:hypothetical protein
VLKLNTLDPNGAVEAEEIAKVVKELFEGEKGKIVRDQAREWKSLAMKAVCTWWLVRVELRTLCWCNLCLES